MIDLLFKQLQCSSLQAFQLEQQKWQTRYENAIEAERLLYWKLVRHKFPKMEENLAVKRSSDDTSLLA